MIARHLTDAICAQRHADRRPLRRPQGGHEHAGAPHRGDQRSNRISATCGALIVAGAQDPLAAPREVDALTKVLREAGATVSLHWEPGGHPLTAGGVEAARIWLVAQT